MEKRLRPRKTTVSYVKKEYDNEKNFQEYIANIRAISESSKSIQKKKNIVKVPPLKNTPVLSMLTHSSTARQEEKHPYLKYL